MGGVYSTCVFLSRKVGHHVAKVQVPDIIHSLYAGFNTVRGAYNKLRTDRPCLTFTRRSGLHGNHPGRRTGIIPVQAISLNPGSNVSSDALSLANQPIAADNVRTALYYGIDWGYAETAPYQVALAVWWVQDNTWQAAEHATAEQIGTTAVNSPGTPSWNPDGVSLLNVIQSGQVTVAPLSLTPSSQYASLGSGSLQVTNTSPNSINVFLPYGTVFGGPTTQTLVWASGEGSQGPAATPTTAPEATATVADPAAPGATPVVTGKGDGQPAAPTATITTKTMPGKGKTTPPAQNTPAPPADTATPLPTATTEPTLAPTDTPQPAPTEAVADTGSNTGIPSQQNSKAPGTTGNQSPQSESMEAPSAPSGPSEQQNTTGKVSLNPAPM